VWWRKWFARVENFSIKDAERSDRPRTMDTDKIITLVDANLHVTIREIQKILGMSHGSVVAYLERHWLCEQNECVGAARTERQEPATALGLCMLKKNKKHPFLKKMITGDKKMNLQYVNRKRSWRSKDSYPQTAAKAGLHPKKMMLCIRSDIKEVIYYELLPENQTIDAAKYCEQLDCLREFIQQKRSELANKRDVTFAKKLLEFS